MLAQQLLNGLVTGSVYALFALGFTLIFGTHKILNLAHAGVFMAGAFVAYFAVINGLPLWIAFILAMVGAGLVSWIVDLAAFARLRTTGQIEFGALISSIGANLCLMSVAQRLSNTKVLRFPFDTFPIQFYNVAGLRISLLQIVIALVVTALLAGMMFFLYKTSFGRQIRAVSGNERVATLLGVSPALVFFQTFFISGALAGIAGVLIGLSFNSIHFLMGEPYLLKAFVVVVLGGLGSVHGAVIAGLLLGVFQTLTVSYLPSALSDTIIYALLFVVLLLKPSGLFGNDVAQMGVARR
jgi:branched-chain amino acid transport system permease protein